MCPRSIICHPSDMDWRCVGAHRDSPGSAPPASQPICTCPYLSQWALDRADGFQKLLHKENGTPSNQAVAKVVKKRRRGILRLRQIDEGGGAKGGDREGEREGRRETGRQGEMGKVIYTDRKKKQSENLGNEV